MLSLPSNHTTNPVEVHALATGELNHPDRWLFEDGDEDVMGARHPYPDFSFLIRHSSGKNDFDQVPELIRSLFHVIQPSVAEDPVDILSRGPVSPSSIDAVVFSHVHFDHIGDPTKFPQAEMIVGPGATAANGEGWPVNPKSPFSSFVVQHPKLRELSFDKETWAPLGPFDRAYDFFGDGSFYLIDTPGHMPGHLGGLALTGPDEWVFMGGDCCHHRSILVGSRPMSVTSGPMGRCFHSDPKVAGETLEKIRQVEKSDSVFVALAHDSFLVGTMPQYPQSLNGWSQSGWSKDLQGVLSRHYKS
ncbi:hypothetical protein AYL99_11488 [Fonsecaea erecta]|uniref:Metallo-beta-lactamase domain-containing protein n=1 Tax=Fonsecaea erecta TaxID=1367422 RepID=A0A178Z3R7_9EURO|nr:hypothetical protein AYL99_11488 [Fonsecaea erecta]OAP54387.1 hypothetical protein AYL99_11488 [Fonsecaea erecta]